MTATSPKQRYQAKLGLAADPPAEPAATPNSPRNRYLRGEYAVVNPPAVNAGQAPSPIIPAGHLPVHGGGVPSHVWNSKPKPKSPAQRHAAMSAQGSTALGGFFDKQQTTADAEDIQALANSIRGMISQAQRISVKSATGGRAVQQLVSKLTDALTQTLAMKTK